MTRQEFIDDVTEWDELIDFCNHLEIETCNDVYSDTAYDEEVRSDINEYDGEWYELRDELDDLPLSFDGYYYIRDGFMEWREADDDDFHSRKNDARDEADRWGYWDDTSDDEDAEEYQEVREPEDECRDSSEVIVSCSSLLTVMSCGE